MPFVGEGNGLPYELQQEVSHPKQQTSGQTLPAR